VKKPSATLIGAFVLGALALIVAGVLFFGAGGPAKARIPLVSFFHGSVAGLRVGAPVTFRGVRVGEVRSIGIRLHSSTGDSIIQVNMELLPGTVRVYDAPEPSGDKDLILALVGQGLTARLVLESFVTRLLNVDLEFRPGAQVSRMGETGAVPEVPTVAGEWEGIAKQLQDVDVASALASAERTLTSVNEILTSPEVKQTIQELPRLVSDLRRTVNTVDREVTALSGGAREAIAGASASLQKALASVHTLTANLDREATSTLSTARGTFKAATTTVDSANVLLDPRGRTVIQVQRAIDDLAAASARLRNLAERVDRDPAVLVRGR
jgi:paraquat-inducible protein B